MRTEVLRLAGWRAARSGLDDSLIAPAGRPAPAPQVIRTLIDHVALFRCSRRTRCRHRPGKLVEVVSDLEKGAAE